MLACFCLWKMDANKDPLDGTACIRRVCNRQTTGCGLYMVYQTEALLEDINKLSTIRNRLCKKRLYLWVQYPGHGRLVQQRRFHHFRLALWGSGVAVLQTNHVAFNALTDIPFLPGHDRRRILWLLHPARQSEALLCTVAAYKTINREQEKRKTLRQFLKRTFFRAIAAKIEAIIAE